MSNASKKSVCYKLVNILIVPDVAVRAASMGDFGTLFPLIIDHIVVCGGSCLTENIAD